MYNKEDVVAAYLKHTGLLTVYNIQHPGWVNLYSPFCRPWQMSVLDRRFPQIWCILQQ